MSTHGNGARLGTGFSPTGTEGRWTEGKSASLALDVPLQTQTSSWQMEVTTQAFVVHAHPSLTVEVRVNGEKVTEWEFTDASQQKRVVTIPSHLLEKAKYALKEAQQLALIEFNMLNPVSPKALGMNQDPRDLGLKISKLTFSQFHN